MKRAVQRWALVPIVIAAYVALYIGQTYDLPMRSVLYPYLLIAALMVLVGIEVSVNSRNRDPGLKRDPYGAQTTSLPISFETIRTAVGSAPMLIVLSTLLFAAIIGFTGFILTTFLYLSTIMFSLKSAKLLSTLMTSGIFSILIGWLVLDVMQLRFPRFAFIELPWLF